MSTVNAGVTTSLDGYVAAPGDGPGKGLGERGEPLHNWVFGGSWAYADAQRPTPTGQDADYLQEMIGRLGAVVTGRNTYEAAGHWGDATPWGVPVFVVSHRDGGPGASPDFTFVEGVEQAIRQAGRAAGERHVHVMGGAQVIRQALASGLVDELTIIIAPILLGSGKRLFEGFQQRVELEQLGARQSPFATFLDYRVLHG